MLIPINKNTLLEPAKLSATELQARHQHYLQAATSENTRKTYRSAVRHFERWGGCLPSDNETIVRYLLESVGKLRRHSAIIKASQTSWVSIRLDNDHPIMAREYRSSIVAR